MLSLMSPELRETTMTTTSRRPFNGTAEEFAAYHPGAVVESSDEGRRTAVTLPDGGRHEWVRGRHHSSLVPGDVGYVLRHPRKGYLHHPFTGKDGGPGQWSPDELPGAPEVYATREAAEQVIRDGPRSGTADGSLSWREAEAIRPLVAECVVVEVPVRWTRWGFPATRSLWPSTVA